MDWAPRPDRTRPIPTPLWDRYSPEEVASAGMNLTETCRVEGEDPPIGSKGGRPADRRVERPYVSPCHVRPGSGAIWP
jgi:hypothetical protein